MIDVRVFEGGFADLDAYFESGDLGGELGLSSCPVILKHLIGGADEAYLFHNERMYLLQTLVSY